MNTVKEVINEYNSKITDLDKEIPITNDVAVNACILKVMLDNRGIQAYDIIASPLGTIYFEWYNKNYSFGISVGKTPIIELEILNKNNYKSQITKHNMQDSDIEKLFEALKVLK